MTIESKTRLLPPESKEFVGKTVLITGGSSGIGLETAKLFHQNEAHVVIFDVQPRPDFLAGSGHRQVDVSDFSQVSNGVSGVVTELGGLDIVVNNAAIKYPGNILEVSQEQIEQMLRVNALGFWNVAKATIPYLIESGGILVNVCSGTSESLPPNADGYFASKGLTYSLTNALRSSFANQNVKIVGIAPGPVDTPLWRVGKAGEQVEAALSGKAGPEVLRPQDIANMIVGLSSKKNRELSETFYRY